MVTENQSRKLPLKQKPKVRHGPLLLVVSLLLCSVLLASGVSNAERQRPSWQMQRVFIVGGGKLG